MNMDRINYRGTNYPYPAHIVARSSVGETQRVNTLFTNVSTSGKPDLYSFVVELSRKSASVISKKRASCGIVRDLCEILHGMYGVGVWCLVGADINSWVVVQSDSFGLCVFLDMKRVQLTSLEGRGLTGYFCRDRTFLDNFESTARYTPLVRCFEYAAPLSCLEVSAPDACDILHIGPGESFTSKGFDLPTGNMFPWAHGVSTDNSQPIICNVVTALCAYSLALPTEHLIANAERFYLMQKPNFALAMVSFVSNEYEWVSFTQAAVPDLEHQFTMMLKHTGDVYGEIAHDVSKRLLVYYTRHYHTVSTLSTTEATECYVWLTEFQLQDGDLLAAVVLRETQAQESTCYYMRTDSGTTLPIIWTSNKQVYRAMVAADNHPSFGSIQAFQSYVSDNIMAMMRVTAATSDTAGLLRLVQLFESLFQFVVVDVRTYMERCDWVACDIFLGVICMYRGNSATIDLSTFLDFVHSTQRSTVVCSDIAIIDDKVLFLTMPSENRCISAKAFHAVVNADPDKTAGEIMHNAFQLFLSKTSVGEREMVPVANSQIAEPQETDEHVSFTFPRDVDAADKVTLSLLLQSKGLQHLLALSPFVPVQQSWIASVVREGNGDDVFWLAQNARLVGITADLVIFVLDKKMHVSIVGNTQPHESVENVLILAVVRAYNTLISNTILGTADIKFTFLSVVLLFRAFNVGYREAKCDHGEIDTSLLCQAIIHVLCGTRSTTNTYLGAVWATTVDFLLSGAISHQAQIDLTSDSGCVLKINSDILDALVTAVHILYLGRVQTIEILSGSIYSFKGSYSSTFLVEPSLLEKHERLLHNVELCGIDAEPSTIGILASIVIGCLYGKPSTVHHMPEIYGTVIPSRKSPNVTPFIVRQILRVIWGKYHDHFYFPDVEHDNSELISTWERNIQDESVPFHRAVLNLILVGDHARDSIVVFDHTVSGVIQNGIGSKEPATVLLLVTDWPLVNTWDNYICNIGKLSSAINVYKSTNELQPVSSLLNFYGTVTELWPLSEAHVMSALLPTELRSFLWSTIDIVQQITQGTPAIRDEVVNVLDQVVIDDGVSLITHTSECSLQLSAQKKHHTVLVTAPYSFALLNQCIALPFNSASQQVTLHGHIDRDLMLITNALMNDDFCTRNVDIITNPDVSDGFLTCMNMIPVEKQKRAALLCVGSMVGEIQPVWLENEELFMNSVIQAVKQTGCDHVTTETRRRVFLRNLFIPFMGVLNEKPAVGACVLLVPSHSCDYTIFCTESTTDVGTLNGVAGSLVTSLEFWLDSIANFLLNTPVTLSFEKFMEGSRRVGPAPVIGVNAEHVFRNIHAGIYRWNLSSGLIGVIARASVLNAWTKDVPAVEIYTRKHLIATGRQMVTS